MASSPPDSRRKLIVDSIHGDIHLTDLERGVIDTASFQRLRHLKQLGMAQATYPNATHTRFAHSIGVLGIMERVAEVAKAPLNLSDQQVEDIRLAGLLHDIGHYPYSHLMERVDKVLLTEDFLATKRTLDATLVKYPDHEQVGEWIVTTQKDIVEALGGPDRAARIAELFTRKTKDLQLSKLIHSSLDMDRLDYLLRDSHATGVPYGRIDINYILNNLQASPSGLLGVREKALAAVEHFVLARYFMHKAVYYHKTTFGLEEACRQLLRRIRNAGKFSIPADGRAIEQLVKGNRLSRFTDATVDGFIESAADDNDPVVSCLAKAIRNRTPPKLLREVSILEEKSKTHHAGATLKLNCRLQLANLSAEFGIPVGRFFVCETPPLGLEQRGAKLDEKEARKLESEEKEELIKVFTGFEVEPTSIVNVDHSILHICSNHVFQMFRLYFVPGDDDSDDLVERLKDRTSGW